jgi:hypothetical protein
MSEKSAEWQPILGWKIVDGETWGLVPLPLDGPEPPRETQPFADPADDVRQRLNDLAADLAQFKADMRADMETLMLQLRRVQDTANKPRNTGQSLAD